MSPFPAGGMVRCSPACAGGMRSLLARCLLHVFIGTLAFPLYRCCLMSVSPRRRRVELRGVFLDFELCRLFSFLILRSSVQWAFGSRTSAQRARKASLP